jgi:hypothetical protein
MKTILVNVLVAPLHISMNLIKETFQKADTSEQTMLRFFFFGDITTSFSECFRRQPGTTALQQFWIYV